MLSCAGTMFFNSVYLIILISSLQTWEISAKNVCQSNTTTLNIFDLLNDPCKYDKWARPTHDNDDPTNVSIAIRVYFLGSIDVQNLQFTVQIVMSYRWLDPRLKHDGGDTRGEGTLRDAIWTPHLYLANEHDSKLMGSGQPDVRVVIDKDGNVTCDTRIKATLLCFMDLRKFPFDEQHCPLTLESWSYNTTQLLLKWEKNTPVTVKSQTRFVPEYSLYDVWTSENISVYSIDESSYFGNPYDSTHHQSKFAGNYSSLTVQFWLKRDYGYYIMDYYVPSILLVVVSWVSFWLDPNAVPGRTTLGTSTMLTFITLSRNIGSSLPKVSYIKSTEIWFMVCTAFIFGSLVEFAFVNTIWRRRKNVELKKKNTKHILKSTLTPQLKRKEIPTIDRSQSFTSLSDSKFSSTVLPQKYNSQLTVNSLDSISKDPFPLNNFSEETLAVSVPVLETEPAHKGFFTMTPQEIAQFIDKRSRLAFPLAFIIFNLFYWVFIWY